MKKVLASLALVPVVASAAVPAGVTTAIADMSTDATTVATAFLVATIALIAFLFMRKGAKG
jgi:hypothetical protein